MKNIYKNPHTHTKNTKIQEYFMKKKKKYKSVKKVIGLVLGRLKKCYRRKVQKCQKNARKCQKCQKMLENARKNKII